jgi:formylglycine-generating enzyme required for sulfatase activity
MRRTILVLCFGLMLIGMALPALAEKRVALVAGIDQYDNLKPDQQLKKAVNDARAIGAALKSLGYDVVVVENAARLDFMRQWQSFLNHIEPGDETAVFFAGHGVEIGGLNFLLPRDVPRFGRGEDEVLKAAALSVTTLLEQVRDKKPQVSLYVLDACRDNPFSEPGGRGLGGTRGLARIDPPRGTFVMFSAGTGEVALDRLSDDDPDPNSVYTRSLLPRLTSPGKNIADIARELKVEVGALAQRAAHVQTPAYYDEVVGEFCPAGCEAGSPAPAAAAPPAPAAPASDPALDAWNAAKDTESASVLEAFVAKFGDSFYASLAKAKLDELKQRAEETKVAVATPPAPVSPSKRVEPAVVTVPKPEAPTQYKPGETFKDCDQCPEMVVVPAGEFLMGTSAAEIDAVKPEFSLVDWEGPQHKVTIAKPFAAGKLEVTVNQFDAFVKETGFKVGEECLIWKGEFKSQPGSFRSPGFEQSGENPAVCLSYDDAKAYVAWLSNRTGKDYRLLTEAEWEYAARGATTATPQSRYSFGNNEKDICTYANGADLTFKSKFATPVGTPAPCKDGYVFTAPAGSFKANGFGLHDMSGNAMEWVEGCGQLNYIGAPEDGSAWLLSDCSTRMNRGGSWHLGAEVQRSAVRAPSPNINRANMLGFRVARTL